MIIKMRNSLFYIAYFLLLFSYMFECVYLFDNYIKIIKFISILFILFSIFLSLKKRKRKNELLFIIIMLLINLIVLYISKEEKILILSLFVIACKKINIEKLIKFDATIKISFLIIVSLLYKLGLTEIYDMVRENGQIRYSMGFSHPNVFAAYLFSATLSLFFVLFNKNYKKSKLIFLLIASIILGYNITSSRTLVISIIVLIVFLCFSKKNLKILKIAKYLPITIAAISLILGYAYNSNNQILNNLNTLSSQRVYFMNKFLNEYNVTLFGNKIEYISSIYGKENGIEAMVLDNAYLLFILKYGIIMTIIFGYMLIKTLKKFEHDRKVIIPLISFMIYGFFESGFIYLNINIFLLYLSSILYLPKDE